MEIFIALPFVWTALWAWRNRQLIYVHWLRWRAERNLKRLGY